MREFQRLREIGVKIGIVYVREKARVSAEILDEKFHDELANPMLLFHLIPDGR
jgi:hypothetical protein